MHTLIVCPIAPPGRYEMRGGLMRMRQTVRAAGLISQRVTVLHLCPPGLPVFDRCPDELSTEQSAFWGTEVEVRLAETDPALPHTFRRYYMDGLLHPLLQPEFRRYSGPRTCSAIATALLDKPDLVVVQQLWAMAPFLAGQLFPTRLIFDLNDLEHKARWRAAWAAPWRPGKILMLANAAAVFPAVAAALRRSAASFVCSEVDRAHLSRLGLGSRVYVMPNAVSFPARGSLPAPIYNRTLLFLGSYGYAPNRHAAEHLIQHIWPLIRAELPDAQLVIAGGGAEEIAGYHSPPEGVSFPGYVTSLDSLYGGVAAVCCPITNGGGTRLKLIEAAAYAKPIVSTTIGAEGLDLRDGEDLLLRDDDAGFAAACVAVLTEPKRAAALGASARLAAESRYDSTVVERNAAEVMTTVAQRP